MAKVNNVGLTKEVNLIKRESGSTATLATLKREEKAQIVKVNAQDKKIRRRLFDMGLTRGADIEFIKKAPLGDPIEVKVRGYYVSLRANDAEFIDIKIK